MAGQGGRWLWVLKIFLLALLAPAATSSGQIRIMAGSSGSQPQAEKTQVILEESSRATELLEQFTGHIQAENYAEAAAAAAELAGIGSDKLVRESRRGAQQLLRGRIYALDAEQRRLFAAAMAPQADAALAAARLNGASDSRLLDVYRSYPGSRAADEALALLSVRALEQGRLEQAADWLSLRLDDPHLDEAAKARAATMLGFCGFTLGRAQIIEMARAQLPAAASGMQFSWAGKKLNPADALQQMAEDLVPLSPPLTTTGLHSSGAGRKVELPANAAGMYLQGQLDHIGQAGTTFGAGRAELLRSEVGRAESERPTAVVAGEEAIFTAEGTMVAAFDRHSGRQLWQQELTTATPQNAIIRRGVAAGGCEPWIVHTPGRIVVALPLGDGLTSAATQLLVLDDRTGKTLWQWLPPGNDQGPGMRQMPFGPAGANPGEAIPPPDVPAGQLSPGSDQRPLDDNRNQPPPRKVLRLEELYPMGIPLVHGGRLYMVAGTQPVSWQATPVDAYLVCLDLQSRQLQWTCFLGSDLPTMDAGGWSVVRPAPVTDGRNIYTQSGVNSLAAVDLRLGEIVWAQPFVPGDARPGWHFRGQMQDNTQVCPVPLLVDDHLLISSGRQGQLWSVDLETGQAAWKVDEPSPLLLGVYDGQAVLSDLASDHIVLRNLADGTQRRQLSVRSPVRGRPLLAANKLILPTDAGLLALDLGDASQELLIESQREAAEPVAVSATSDGLVFVKGEAIYNCTDVQQTVARLKKRWQDNPDELQWALQLAAVYQQQKLWTEAEGLLDGVLKSLADSSDGKPAEPAYYARAGREQMAGLYAAWAEALPADDVASRLGKWQQALLWCDTSAGQMSALMKIADYAHLAGRTDEAATAYRQVMETTARGGVVLLTDADGVRRSPMVVAAAALARLGAAPQDEGEAASPAAKGSWLADCDFDRLQANILARLSWAPGIRFVSDDKHPAVPVVWLRSDGLVAFGPGGKIVWMTSHPPQGTINDLWLIGDKLIERRGQEFITRSRNTGRVLERWQSESEILMFSDSRPAVNRRVQVRRVIIIDGQVVQMVESKNLERPGSSDSVSPMALEDGLLLPVSTGNQGSLVKLDSSTGRPTWQLNRGINQLASLFVMGDKAAVATDEGGGTIAAYNADDGQLSWRHENIGKGFTDRIITKDELVLAREESNQSRPGQPARVWRLAILRFGNLEKPEVVDVTVNGAHQKLLARQHNLTVIQQQDGLAAFDDEGQVVWNIRLPSLAQGGVASHAVDADKGLLVLAAMQEVLCFSIADGKLQWRINRHPPDAERPGQGLKLLRVGDCVVIWSQGSPTLDLLFLDFHTGKLRGGMALGASTGQVSIEPIAGGLLVVNGDEVLTVTPPPATDVSK